MSEWKPMFLAPKDGTPICALHADQGMITAVRFVLSHDGVGTILMADTWEDSGYKPTEFCGWIALPDVPAWNGVPGQMVDDEKKS